MAKHPHISAIAVLILLAAAHPDSLPAQTSKPRAKTFTIPAELTPSDSDIQSLLGPDDGSCKPLNGNEWTDKLQDALKVAESRGLVGDKALIEATLGSAVVAQGNTERAFALFQKALQDSIDARRSILQADVLISLASESQMKGNTQDAIDRINVALSLAEKTGNLYGKARALGELGQLQLQLGKNEQAATLLDQALDIDKLNGYRFEARHLLYKSIYLGVIGQEDAAVQLLAQARIKAIAANDVITFVQAEDTYAFGLVKKGRADEAIRQMDLLKRNDLSEFIDDPSTRSCFASHVQLPLVRLIWLEGFANILEAANQKEKEIEIWEEVFSTSQDLGLVAGQAEAKEKSANLKSQLKKNDEALKDYAIAVNLYRKLGSETLLNRVQISESVLLVNSGRGTEAISLVEEIASYAKRLNLRLLEFRACITLSGIFQSSGDFSKARDALERAKSLIHPRPFDEEIDNKAIHLAYVSLSDIYRKLQIPTKELVSIDQAFFVSLHLKDEEAQHKELSYLDQRIGDLRLREVVEQRQKQGQLTESLIYSYILYLRDGPSTNPVEDQNWQRILSLPFQIAQKPGGADDLTWILTEVGPFLALEKLPLLTALARHYVAVGEDPILIEKYALEAEKIVDGFKGDQSALKVESACELAVSYARQGKRSLAETKSAECLSLAAKTHDEQTITYAQAANSMAQAQVGNIAAARSSLEKLISRAPDNPELLVELAMSLASAKLYEEASMQLGSATGKLLSAGDKKNAASAYARMSIILNSDSSDTAKKLQLDYLRAASNLYHEYGAAAEEAEALIALGDYFIRVTQNSAAIEEYTKAHKIAQRVGQKNITAQAFLGLGNAYQAQKDYATASTFHGQAASAFHELKNSVGETNSLRNLGRDYYELNDPQQALVALLGARKTASNSGPFLEYLTAYSLGDFYISQGEYEKALASYRDAAEITEKASDAEHSAFSHLALAGADSFVGDWESSVAESEIALSLFQKSGNKEGEGFCWAHLTNVYADRTSSLKDFDKAQDCYRKAMDLGYGKTLELDLMEIYLQTGRFVEAAKIAREGVQDCLKEKDAACQAHALISLSEAERLRGNLKESRSALDRAATLVARSPDLYLKGRLEYQGSRLLVSEGKLSEALSSYEQLISLIEGVKGKLGAREQRSLAENYGFIYDELVSLLYSMSMKFPAEQLRLASNALEYAEKNKARQFSESWGRVFKNQMAMAIPVATREREQSLSLQRDRLATDLQEASNSSDAAQKSRVADLNSQLASVQKQIQMFLKDLRTVAPQYAAIAYPENVQISTLPLQAGETLVEFKVAEDSTFVWIVRKVGGDAGNQLKLFYEIPRKRTWFLQQVESVRKALNSPYPEGVDLGICEQLFAALFPGGAAKIILDSEKIILIPDDVLFVLPFELYSPNASKGEFPLLRKATTYYPSAVSFRLARSAKLPTNWQEAFLGIADPITSPEDERFVALQVPQTTATSGNLHSDRVMEASLPNAEKLRSRGFSFAPLPGTAKEIQSIASLIRQRNEVADVRVGVDATKEKLLDTDLSQFRFLHFATHGVLAVDTGIQEPSLVLSIDRRNSSRMFLSMSEILSLRLQSELVVLSACNTGSGKISRAEGVMSLGRAFLAAGATSVTVSLWQVSDDSTALFMKTYYQGILQNKKKNQALADARYAVFTSGSKSPFFWAPFIIIGE